MDEVDALPTEKKSRRFTFLLAGVLLKISGHRLGHCLVPQDLGLVEVLEKVTWRTVEAVMDALVKPFDL